MVSPLKRHLQKKRLLRLISAGMVLVSTCFPSVGRAEDWTTRGKTTDRRQMTAEWLGEVEMQPAWSRVLGASGSQPILVGNTIYHLAGHALWMITMDGTATRLVDNINDLHAPTSFISYETVNGTGALYFGTGDNWLCARRLDDGAMLNCVELKGSKTDPIVTAPLVFPPTEARPYDLVVMGDKNGNLWVVKDLATDRSKTRSMHFVADGRHGPSWLLASPVPSGEDLGFIFGVDSPANKVGARRIIPGAPGSFPALTDAWDSDTYVPSGVTDGFARDDDFVYASDKTGVFLRINRMTGAQSLLNYGTTFTNATPAVDEKSVYFALRHGESINSGRLVAVDKTRWDKGRAAVKWERDLPAPINTNPLVLVSNDHSGESIVLVGDTSGTLYAFNAANGEPHPFVNGMQSQLNVRGLSQAGKWYQAVTGVIDPILAAGSSDRPLLVTGVSGTFDPGDEDSMGACPGTGSRECGVLVAYRTRSSKVDFVAGPIQAPDRLPCIPGANIEIEWSVHTDASRDQQGVPYTVRIMRDREMVRPVRAGKINLPVGDKPDREVVHLNCGATYRIELSVNSPVNPELATETNRDNNDQTHRLVIDPYSAAPITIDPESSERKVIIIPADCQTNPDVTSDHPCKNYPGLTIR